MDSTGRITVWGLLRNNQPFRMLWLGTVVSFLGDWFTTVAVLTVADELTDAALAYSAVIIAKTLPVFLVAPFAGPWVDRFDRRRLMVGTDVVRAFLVVLMILAYQQGSFVWFMVFLTTRTTVSGVFIPARNASVPDLAPGEQLATAVALNGGTWSVMLSAGAALGGVATAWLGVQGALVVDGLSFVLSGVFLTFLPPLPPRDEHAVGGTSFREGLEELRGRVYLPCLLLLKGGMSIHGASLVLLPLWAGGMFPGYQGPIFLGLLYAGRGVGTLFGSMGLRQIIGDRRDVLEWAIVPAFFGLGVAYLCMANAQSYWISALLLTVGMVGSGVIWTFSDLLAQLATRREVRGRLFSLEFGIGMLVSAASSLGAGLAVDQGVSPRTVMAVVGLLMFLPGMAWLAVLLWARDRPVAVG